MNSQFQISGLPRNTTEYIQTEYKYKYLYNACPILILLSVICIPHLHTSSMIHRYGTRAPPYTWYKVDNMSYIPYPIPINSNDVHCMHMRCHCIPPYKTNYEYCIVLYRAEMDLNGWVGVPNTEDQVAEVPSVRTSISIFYFWLCWVDHFDRSRRNAMLVLTYVYVSV